MGRRTTMTRENLQTDSYRYDPTGQLVGVDYSLVGASLATPSSGNNGNPNSNNGKGNSSSTGILPVSPRIETFSYDPLGNRIEHTDTGDGNDQPPLLEQYETNALNQYTQITKQTENGELAANAGNSQSQENPSDDTTADAPPLTDQDENIASDDTQPSPSTPASPSPSTLTYTHDANGNLTDDGTQLYSYDAQNRLVEVESATVKAEFAYDARNRCILRRYYTLDSNGAVIPDEANSVAMTYDLAWNILSDRSLSVRQTAEYIHGNRVDEILAQVRDSGQVYPLSDAVNSTIMLVGQNGSSLGAYHYDAFGRPSGEDAGYRYLYTGREWLPTVGLNDHRYRYYNPNIGSWISRDPVGLYGGFNLYGMVNNNPVNTFDPFGLAPTLSASTVSGPTYGECGDFTWTIQWAVDQASDSKNGGQVLQDIKYETEALDDLGQPISGYPKNNSFSETWAVMPGTQTINGFSYAGISNDPNANHDTYSGDSIVGCTKGKTTVTGSARYYPNQSSPSWSTGKKGNGTLSKDLLSSPTNPNWPTAGTSNVVTHQIVVKWDCLKGRSQTIEESKTLQ